MRATRGNATSVRFFEELYAIVVGLGLALSIEQVIDVGRSGLPLTLDRLPLFLAYLNIAFPLAHSSIRYLELAYVDKEAGVLAKGRVLGDLVLGTGQFLFLLALSFLVARPIAFVVTAIVLLVGRPVRDALVQVTGGTTLVFDRTVARVHGATIAILAVTLVTALLADGDDGTWVARWGSLAASLAFALGLYLSAFDYFFSDNVRAGEPEPAGGEGAR